MKLSYAVCWKALVKEAGAYMLMLQGLEATNDAILKVVRIDFIMFGNDETYTHLSVVNVWAVPKFVLLGILIHAVRPWS